MNVAILEKTLTLRHKLSWLLSHPWVDQPKSLRMSQWLLCKCSKSQGPSCQVKILRAHSSCHTCPHPSNAAASGAVQRPYWASRPCLALCIVEDQLPFTLKFYIVSSSFSSHSSWCILKHPSGLFASQPAAGANSKRLTRLFRKAEWIRGCTCYLVNLRPWTQLLFLAAILWEYEGEV